MFDPSLFTPTQRRMLAVLSDGLPHTRLELAECLEDDLANPASVKKHLYLMRKVLRAQGQEIVCEWAPSSSPRQRYRHVILLPQAPPSR